MGLYFCVDRVVYNMLYYVCKDFFSPKGVFIVWYVVIDTFTCSTGDLLEETTILEKVSEMGDYVHFQIVCTNINVYLNQYEINNHLEEYESYYNI